jgi:hypothetical protein
LFYFAVGLVCMYAIVAYFAFRALRKGNLGEDETGKKASFPHPMFFLVLGMTVLGGSLFTQIMKFLLDAFVCDFSNVITIKFALFQVSMGP